MASDRILDNAIARPGQSQDERTPVALDPAHAPVDARSPTERLAEARRLAEHLRYYGFDPDKAVGDWRDYFPDNAGDLLARDDGSVPPHLGLFGAFLHQLEPARDALNALTGSHLDFQYRRVLGFESLPAQPEHAHLTLELKKGAAALAITPDHRFSGGKDAQGAERLYQPLRETVIGQGKVTSLHSIHRSATAGLRFAPVADSADGLGAPLDPLRPHWPAFGHAGLAAAPVGCALAGPVLRMREGTRAIGIDLTLAFLETGQTGPALADKLHAYITGQSGWLGPYPLSGSLAGATLTLGFSVAADEPPVIDYDPAVHGGAFAAGAPVVQLLLRPEAAASYASLARLRVDKAALRVSVGGVRGLSLGKRPRHAQPEKGLSALWPATGQGVALHDRLRRSPGQATDRPQGGRCAGRARRAACPAGTPATRASA
jgi:hypothetical protein